MRGAIQILEREGVCSGLGIDVDWKAVEKASLLNFEIRR